MHVDRFEARAKLSQNRHPDVTRNIVDQLEARHPALAQQMRRVADTPEK